MENKGLRKIKNPYLRQGLVTLIFLSIVYFGLKGEVIVEGPTERDPSEIANFFLYGYALFYLAFITAIYFMREATLKKLDFYPYDFEEADEREMVITAKASRRSFFMMEFILGGGALFSLIGAVLGQREELKWVAGAMAILYVVMHLVYLVTYGKESK